MTDRAPERIWLSRTANDFHAVWLRSRPRGSAFVEYVRADLAPSPPALSGEVESVIERLQATKVSQLDLHRRVCACIVRKDFVPTEHNGAALLDPIALSILDAAQVNDRAQALLEAQAREIADYKQLHSEAQASILRHMDEYHKAEDMLRRVRGEYSAQKAELAAMSQAYADLDQTSRVKISDLQADRRPHAQKWRDNALEAAAQIVAKYYPDDLYCQKDIRALASHNPDGERR